MILDELASAARYEKLHAGFHAGFEFLMQANLASLESGRHEIDGDRVFALINRDPGRGRAGARLEAHRKYIDIQFLVSGQEEIGWRPLA
ncbi:MAG TPA: YhcH/YjgK/YiaL family protein, partial [Pirellulales bacterium]